MKIKTYTDTIKKLKTAILTSRYRAASLANRELLTLYFNVGNLISEKTKQEKWGAKVIEQISDDLQKELPGLRGFSSTNLKNMRTFFDFWTAQFPISQLTTDQLQQLEKPVKSRVSKNSISQLTTDQLQKTGKKKQPENAVSSISQLSTD